MSFLTLADLGRRMTGDGKVADMAELLSQCNELIDDVPWVEANQITNHVTTLRTALPRGTFRRFYQGVPYTASKAAQITYGMAMLDAYSQIDKKMARLGGEAAVREKEDVAHMEGLSQQMSQVFAYGNSWQVTEQFTGFSPYYNSLDTNEAQNAVNVIDGGGVGSANASLWLIGWGESTVYGIYPKGSAAGLEFENKGDVVPGFDSNNQRFEAYTSYFSWNSGLAIEDWRYIVRIPNLDTTTAGLAGATPPDLFAMMSKSVVRLPTAGRMVSGITKTDAPDKMSPSVRLKYYCNRTVRQYMDIQAIRDKNVLLSPTDYAGRPIVNFRNIPIGVNDSFLDNEAAVA